MGRAPCCEKGKVKKGPWSPEEDAKLKSYIEKHGTGGNWIALPHKIGLKRCGKSCRLRWLNYLRPNIRHGGFSEEEDNIICSLYVSIGSRWSIIASHLPGRTDNDIKNYWNTRLKKKLFGNQVCNKEPISSSINSYYINMNHEVNKGKILSPSLLTFNDNNNNNIKSSSSSSSLRDFLVLDDGTTFGVQHLSPSSSSYMDLQTQFGPAHGIEGQTQITSYNHEFRYSDSVSCGESNSSSLGYFTSLIPLPPPPSTLLQQDSTDYGNTGLKFEETQL